MFSYVSNHEGVQVYLLRTRNLHHVIERSAFIARISSAGISTLVLVANTLLRRDCLFVLLRAVSSDCSCSFDDPLLIRSLTSSISELLLFRVLAEAEEDSTLGVVTRTTERGYQRNVWFWKLGDSIMCVPSLLEFYR